jgi:hypothetical protein
MLARNLYLLPKAHTQTEGVWEQSLPTTESDKGENEEKNRLRGSSVYARITCHKGIGREVVG